MLNKIIKPLKFFFRNKKFTEILIPLQEQKEMQKLTKKLPKFQQQLIDDISEWEQEHEKTFTVDGVGFVQYINSQWESLEMNERIEKTQRNQKRQLQLASDMVCKLRTLKSYYQPKCLSIVKRVSDFENDSSD